MVTPFLNPRSTDVNPTNHVFEARKGELRTQLIQEDGKVDETCGDCGADFGRTLHQQSH